MQFPSFPQCTCEMHPVPQEESECPIDALSDPFLYLPPPVEFTPPMRVVAEKYFAHQTDWRYYPAFQAAAFLMPKTPEQHTQRREQFSLLKQSAEAQGFSIPEAITKLFMTDELIDRLHHNCVWPSLPEELMRLPADPRFGVLLFLIEGQGCGIWHLLLAPDGTHRVVSASGRFGCIKGFPPGHMPDFATFEVNDCMDSVNRLLYHYFVESARHDKTYVERLEQYFAEQPT